MPGAAWSLVAAVAAVIGGVVVAFASHYFAPAWLKKAHCRRAARAGLAAIRVYVSAAETIGRHQDLQQRWSQLCADTFGRVAADVAEMGKGGPDLGELGSLLAGWLSQAPFVMGDDAKISALECHLAEVATCLDSIVEAIPRK